MFLPHFSRYVRLIIYLSPDFFTPLAIGLGQTIVLVVPDFFTPSVIGLGLYSECAWLTHDWLLLEGRSILPDDWYYF